MLTVKIRSAPKRQVFCSFLFLFCITYRLKIAASASRHFSFAELVFFKKFECRSKMADKRSSIWQFFEEIDGDRKAKCVECNSTLSRGGVGKTASNSSMINHLKQHEKLYRDYRETEGERKKSKAKQDASQPSISESFSQSLRWDDNSAKAKEITKLIAEMIVLDVQPVSMVENEGFRRLMSKLAPRYKVTLLQLFYCGID